MNLSEITGVVIDMDGVLWRGDERLPAVDLFFNLLHARAIPFALASNNSSKTPADYVAKLAKMGIGGVSERQIVTSGTATVDYLLHHYAAGSAIHVLGGDGLKAMVTAAGFNLSDQANVVVVGIDFNLTYDKLRHATKLIRAGADFIGTNADATFPMPDGLSPGAGSLLAALKTACGREPLVIGKPGKPMFEAALHALGTAAETTLMIGDRLDTDIYGAQQAGYRTALVLTGVNSRADAETGSTHPDGIYDDLAALIAAWV